jgi:hypothetical protein
MFTHLGESSEYTNTDEREFWSSSEDEWIENGSNFCLLCAFFRTAYFVYFCK